MLLGGRGDFIVKIIKWCEENHELAGLLLTAILGSGGLLGFLLGRFMERRHQQIENEKTLYPELFNGIERLRRILNEKGRLTENCKSIYMLEYFQSVQHQCGLPSQSQFSESEIENYRSIVSGMKSYYERGSVNLPPRYAVAKTWKSSWDILDEFFDFITNTGVEDTENKISEITWIEEDAPHIVKVRKLNDAISYISEALEISTKNYLEWMMYKIKSDLYRT